MCNVSSRIFVFLVGSGKLVLSEQKLKAAHLKREFLKQNPKQKTKLTPEWEVNVKQHLSGVGKYSG